MIFQRAAGVHVWQDHRLLRRENFRGLGHEPYAAKGDHVGIGFGRLAGQVEAVSDKIREVLNLGF